MCFSKIDCLLLASHKYTIIILKYCRSSWAKFFYTIFNLYSVCVPCVLSRPTSCSCFFVILLFFSPKFSPTFSHVLDLISSFIRPILYRLDSCLIKYLIISIEPHALFDIFLCRLGFRRYFLKIPTFLSSKYALLPGFVDLLFCTPDLSFVDTDSWHLFVLAFTFIILLSCGFSFLCS